MFEGTNLQKYKILEQNFKTITVPTFSKQCISSFQAYLLKYNYIIVGIKKRTLNSFILQFFCCQCLSENWRAYTIMWKSFSPA